MATVTRYQVNAPNVVHERFEDGEATVINLQSGAYFSLDPSAATIWEELHRGHGPAAIVELLSARHDAVPGEISDAVHAFVEELRTLELIVASSAPQAERTPLDTSEPRTPFVRPTLQRFNDLEDLLLLDPIHDAGDAGWPHKGGE